MWWDLMKETLWKSLNGPFFQGFKIVIFKGWFHKVPPHLQHRYINSFLRLRFGGRMPLFLVYFSYFITYTHTFFSITFTQYIYPSPFAGASLHLLIACKLSRKTSLWCRAENRTRACLTASRRATNRATLHHTNRATPLHTNTLIVIIYYLSRWW